MAERARQQLGNYGLTQLLGRGTFSEVYLGEHVYLHTQAAIKVLYGQLANHDMAGFLTEARTIPCASTTLKGLRSRSIPSSPTLRRWPKPCSMRTRNS
jgi:serine/threonine protein kinase